MEFFKVKKLMKPRKSNEEKDPAITNTSSQELKNESNGTDQLKTNPAGDCAGEIEEDDDDDFITNEVKRQLKELRNKRFLVLIPEESCPEYDDDEEEVGIGSSNWKELVVEGGNHCCGFDNFYEKYCERMLFFDKIITQLLQGAGSQISSNPSPRSASKKLVSTLRSLSFKRREGLQDDNEHLSQLLDNPYQDLETSYVAQLCLTWEALHCQYTELCHKISLYSQNSHWCSHAAQQFQQFQVLLHRFIENEPFEQGGRVEIFARSRASLPKLLWVPSFQDSDQKEWEEEDLDPPVLATDLFRVIESSIMTFYLFLKLDKKESGSTLSAFGTHSQAECSLQQIRASLDKKKIKLREVQRKKKGWKKKSWPATAEEVELLFALSDIKVMSRVLRMMKISKEQLLWCEEKMRKLDISGSKLQRDGSPALFPC